MKGNNKNNINIKNRRATFDYEIIDEYVAGMVLLGTEIKSIRAGKASLVDSFCYFHNGELWMKNANIYQYFYGSYNNHQERRERKLLLNKKELKKIESMAQIPGNTIIPMRMFINDRGFAKTVIAVGRGKKLYDKRASIKDREDRRSMDRAMKNK